MVNGQKHEDAGREGRHCGCGLEFMTGRPEAMRLFYEIALAHFEMLQDRTQHGRIPAEDAFCLCEIGSFYGKNKTQTNKKKPKVNVANVKTIFFFFL